MPRSPCTRPSKRTFCRFHESSTPPTHYGRGENIHKLQTSSEVSALENTKATPFRRRLLQSPWPLQARGESSHRSRRHRELHEQDKVHQALLPHHRAVSLGQLEQAKQHSRHLRIAAAKIRHNGDAICAPRRVLSAQEAASWIPSTKSLSNSAVCSKCSGGDVFF